MFSAGALFPLEIIKTNLQAHTKQRKSSPSPTEEAEGGPGDSATASSGGHEEDKDDQQSLLSTRQSGRHPGQELDDLPPSVTSVAKDIYSREGLGGLYKGTCRD